MFKRMIISMIRFNLVFIGLSGFLMISSVIVSFFYLVLLSPGYSLGVHRRCHS